MISKLYFRMDFVLNFCMLQRYSIVKLVLYNFIWEGGFFLKKFQFRYTYHKLLFSLSLPIVGNLKAQKRN